MGSNAFQLFRKRSFLPFFITQFLGAFNDNLFKLAMLTLISYHLTHSQARSEFYQAMAGALFIAPFFFLSATAGQLADQYDKALVTRFIKFLELFLMIIGSFALYWGNIALMMLTLTGLGVHSTFFGPIKYAILPDHLPKNDLLGATGLIDASTFIAILLGTTMGSLSVGANNSQPFMAVFLTVIIAIVGLISSFFIPVAPSMSNADIKIDVRIWRVTYRMLKLATTHFGIFLSILILSWFWLLGTVILTKLPDYTNYVLGADNTVFALFLALFSLGIACGSITVNIIYKGRINLPMVSWAMFAVSVFSMDLYWATPVTEQNILFSISTFFTRFTHWRIAFDLFMLAFSAGLFVVPLYTYLQVVSPPHARAQIIAANNIYNSLFMVLGTFMVIGLLHFSAAIPRIFLILSLLNLVAALLSKIYLKKV